MYGSMTAKVFEELYEYVPDVAVCGLSGLYGIHGEEMSCIFR
jgi:hypothetical protein